LLHTVLVFVRPRLVSVVSVADSACSSRAENQAGHNGVYETRAYPLLRIENRSTAIYIYITSHLSSVKPPRAHAASKKRNEYQPEDVGELLRLEKRLLDDDLVRERLQHDK